MESIVTRIVVLCALACTGTASAQSAPRVVKDSIPATLVSWEMVHVPGGKVTLNNRTIEVKPLLVGRTEVTWDLYDVYFLKLTEDQKNPIADAVARPSPPYAVPDYEWGHEGYAAISIALNAAKRFAEWLSAKTGHTYRLPTEAEWQHIANLAAGPTPLTHERIDALAWHRVNANRKTQLVAQRKPDALGLFDLFGNVAEWVVADNNKRITRGGSFRDDPATLGPAARAEQQDSWTERDPQLPSSIWWLSDGPFVGFRLVREVANMGR
jgi:formylglycine-generating enzyme required for sulfatase activity